jgi:single-strand DNA-binding protein
VVSEHRNEVIVAGRLSKSALPKELPSGDEIMTWRLIVDRPDGTAGGFDVVECKAFSARVRRQAQAWVPGEVIEVTGALRRRYWRGPGGLRSACEVEVSLASRLTRAPRSRSQPAASAASVTPVRRRRTPG